MYILFISSWFCCNHGATVEMHIFASLTILCMHSQSLTSVARESLRVHEVFVSAKPGAVMETMTAEIGRMRPTAQVMMTLL